MRIASNLFAAGQETTARLLSTSLQILGDRPELQQQLRDDRSLITPFLEEALRLESPIKGTFRLSRVPTTVRDAKIPAGSTVMVLPSAANRDPRGVRGPRRAATRPGERSPAHRVRARHPYLRRCAAGPCRVERVPPTHCSIGRQDIRISESHHGPAGAPPLGLHAHVDAPWPGPAPPRIHPGRLSDTGCTDRRTRWAPTTTRGRS